MKVRGGSITAGASNYSTKVLTDCCDILDKDDPYRIELASMALGKPVKPVNPVKPVAPPSQ